MATRMKTARPVSHGVRIGISGWRYAPWRGIFYPKDLAQKRELEFASRHFDTIEINGSFYSLQHPDSWKRWAAETPLCQVDYDECWTGFAKAKLP